MTSTAVDTSAEFQRCYCSRWLPGSHWEPAQQFHRHFPCLAASVGLRMLRHQQQPPLLADQTVSEDSTKDWVFAEDRRTITVDYRPVRP